MTSAGGSWIDHEPLSHTSRTNNSLTCDLRQHQSFPQNNQDLLACVLMTSGLKPEKPFLPSSDCVEVERVSPPSGQSWNVHGSGTPVPFGLVPPLHRPKADLLKMLSLMGGFIC